VVLPGWITGNQRTLLAEAGQFVQNGEASPGVEIACLEEVAYRPPMDYSNASKADYSLSLRVMQLKKNWLCQYLLKSG